MNNAQFPDRIDSLEQLDDLLSTPTPPVLHALQQLTGDLLVLGAGGKMGPTLVRMAVRALEALDSPHRVVAVSRFSQPQLREQLEAWGARTVACDLLDREAVAALPDSRHVIFMAGQKFGTTGNEALTWAMNVYMPGLVAERYRDAAVVVFSTGNVYPLTPVVHGGARESDVPAPVGEYANSCLGRERMFEYVSNTHGLRCAIMRLNYAVEMRYGVLLDIAQKVHAGQPVDLRMGAANVIWQGDANAQALALLAHCTAPPAIFNVTGPETVSVRRLAVRFGELMGVQSIYTHAEAETALLSNAGKIQRLVGYPTVPLDRIITWTADWVQRGGATLDKPTHFETRDGRF
jgi:nucleoside-diphosphate-sugar epimerase